MDNNKTLTTIKSDLKEIRDINSNIKATKADLTIIGAGMAGLSAALFATNRGISTVITGKRSSMNFATGLMDLMGVHPSGVERDNPWKAIEEIRNDIPKHPYSFVKDEYIKESLLEMVQFLKAQGLFYRTNGENNVNVITSLGTVKKSYLIPESMWKGVAAFEQKAPSLIIDFAGMKIYSAKQIVSTLSGSWNKLQSVRIDFPGMEKLEEVYPEHIARALDIEANRIKLANIVKPILERGFINVESPYDQSTQSSNCKNSFNNGSSNNYGENKFKYIGFPALIGIYRADEAIKHLEELLGISIFEIPTPPVSVPGIRLHEALTQGLLKNSNLIYEPEMVESVEHLEDGTFRIKIANSMAEDESSHHFNSNENKDSTIKDASKNSKKIIYTSAIILATGRFMGKGLTAKRTGIKESLLNLPVNQPEERENWHHKDLFNPQGHPINKAGIEIDNMMRPLSNLGEPFAENLKPFAQNLFAAGSILAHSDWTRMKCGSGVAIATAFAAVKSLQNLL
ncbi:MAG: anaerobic glycerol-3-phosphate dehydrogenase subunit B [Desulfamplus sp.]|nr:anaerobic glycerol-3-phosphate dehydrogenase subunit B [Desulfamplus sp.]